MLLLNSILSDSYQVIFPSKLSYGRWHKPQPLTPACAPFGTRQFNCISAETRIDQGYCSIRPVRVFAGYGHVDAGIFCASPVGFSGVGNFAGAPIRKSELQQILYSCFRQFPLLPNIHPKTAAQPFVPTLHNVSHTRYVEVVFAFRPTGGKSHGYRCGQEVDEMPVLTCQRAGTFTPEITVFVGVGRASLLSVIRNHYLCK